MKLKNTMNDVRQLRVDGQIVEVGPMKTIEIESTKVIYDEMVFKIIETKEKVEDKKIETQKRNEKAEKPTKQEDVK